jgi:hypothetical protein
MEPTPEQLDAVADVLRDLPGFVDGLSEAREQAPRIWNVIAPIVRAQALEEAEAVCRAYEVEERHIGLIEDLRALKAKP